MPTFRVLSSLLVSSLILLACGGTGDSVILPSSSLAQRCDVSNPLRGDASTSITTGSLATEKQWIRSYFDETYLWNGGVPAVDASGAAYTGSMLESDFNGVPLPLSNYFKALKTTQTTVSGAKLDKFSFAYPTRAWNQLSQSGVTAGYGIEWMSYANTPPRNWHVAMVQPGSPAAAVGIRRGDTLAFVDGIDFVYDNTQAGVDKLNLGLFPNAGERHDFVFSRSGSANLIRNMVASSSVTIDPVPVATTITSGTRKIGYLVFTDHIVTAEQKLIDAVTRLRNDQINDLVLDLRYNGGGYLYIASEVGYMIAGANQIGSGYFEQIVHNDRQSARNSTTPFYNTSCIPDIGFTRCASVQPLPTLNLSRLFVLTQSGTCSASEAIMNGLSGIGVQLIQIGSTTCGKPYGFYGQDNCGVTYFPIQFKGVNYQGFSEYSDGFTPVASNPWGASLLGCPAVDDLEHSLSDPNETMLATALYWINNNVCPAATSASAKQTAAAPVGTLLQSEIRSNRIQLPFGLNR